MAIIWPGALEGRTPGRRSASLSSQTRPQMCTHRMRWLATAFVVAVTMALASVGVRADFNECLGLEIATLQTLPACLKLFRACQLGVDKLNEQLGVSSARAFNPVSVISASESRMPAANNSLIAMLIQLAPLTDCSTLSNATAAEESCKFDMAKLEFYSILLTHDASSEWELKGYKRHVLSDDEREQIVEEYSNGDFYGTKLAIGIFDAPDLPTESVSDSKQPAPRYVAVGIAAVASVLLVVGLVTHRRRQNGYARILRAKGSQRRYVQEKKLAKTAPEQMALRPDDSDVDSSGQTAKHEQNERFAV